MPWVISYGLNLRGSRVFGALIAVLAERFLHEVRQY